MDTTPLMDTTIGRRTAIKRVAVVAGGLVWAAPLVQQVNMSEAAAQTSPAPGGGAPGGGNNCIRLLGIKICR